MITAPVAIRKVLAADPSVAALVGDRIAPPPVVQASTMPAVTYQRISTVEPVDLDGMPGLCRIRLQVDCWAPTQDAAEELAEAVKAKLRGFSGTVEGRSIKGVFVDGENDAPYEPDVKLHRVSADYLVVFKGETV